MRLWAKSLRIFKCLCEHSRQGVRRIALQTGLSKSSVHRLKQAMARRDRHPESCWWETEEGRCWLLRLVVATLYTFGLKRGVGVETISVFFARLHLETQGGCSPSVLRGVMQTLEATLLETAGDWEQDGLAEGEAREMIGAVDETFFEHMMLVFMDRKTGYLLREVVAEARTYATWKALVEERLTALKTRVRYLVSDRAKAFIQLAAQGLACRSMPDFFPVMHDLVQGSSLAMARHVRHAQQALKQAEATLARLQVLSHAEPAVAEAQVLLATRQAEVRRGEEAHATSRGPLQTLSLTLHPFRIADSAPQTSAQVESHLQETVAAIEALGQRHQVPVHYDAMTKVRKQ